MPANLIGVSTLMRLAYRGGDVKAAWDGLMARALADPTDAPALMDLSVLLQIRGDRQNALSLQKNAIEMQSSFRRVFGDGSGVRVAALVTAGDMMANTPVDFLLEGSDVVLDYVYVDADTSSLPGSDACDVMVLAVGESDANVPVLRSLERLIGETKHPPIVNAAPAAIAALTREGVSATLAGCRQIVAPRAAVVGRAALARASQAHDNAPEFPLVVRPRGTHAGGGMARLTGAADVTAYLAKHPDAAFHVMPYVDYAGADGLFRKQRIVFIDGMPFASHLAVSEHWIVHYLSAGMAEHAWRRDEEARWMETFDTDFAVRHADAFEALHERIGLDYFGIDCAEMPDGRLLVFEADVAMIVHDMDPPDMFPYKVPAMKKLFAAFRDAFSRRAAKATA